MKKTSISLCIAFAITGCSINNSVKEPFDQRVTESRNIANLDVKVNLDDLSKQNNQQKLVAFEVITYESNTQPTLNDIATFFASQQAVASRLINNNSIIAFEKDNESDDQFINKLNKTVISEFDLKKISSNVLFSNVGEPIPYAFNNETSYPKSVTHEKNSHGFTDTIETGIIMSGVNTVLNLSVNEGKHQFSVDITSTSLNGFRKKDFNHTVINLPNTNTVRLKAEFEVNSKDFLLIKIKEHYLLIKPYFKP